MAPGLYDRRLGETFPLVISPFVEVIGDVHNLGGPELPFPTSIRGHEPMDVYHGTDDEEVAIVMEDGARLAGFHVAPESRSAASSPPVGAFVVHGSDVAIESCTILGFTWALRFRAGPSLGPPPSGGTVAGNVVETLYAGMVFEAGVLDVSVSRNRFCCFGGAIEVNGPAADLGGGARSSPGLNTFGGGLSIISAYRAAGEEDYVLYAKHNVWPFWPIVPNEPDEWPPIHTNWAITVECEPIQGLGQCPEPEVPDPGQDR